MSMVEIINGIQGRDPGMQFQATQSARRLLSRERQPPIDDVIKAGIIPRLVEFLGTNYEDRQVTVNTGGRVVVTILVSFFVGM